MKVYVLKYTALSPFGGSFPAKRYVVGEDINVATAKATTWLTQSEFADSEPIGVEYAGEVIV